MKQLLHPTFIITQLFLLFIFLSLYSVKNLDAQIHTSNTNERLKKLLEQFPQADSNQDGVLI